MSLQAAIRNYQSSLDAFLAAPEYGPSEKAAERVYEDAYDLLMNCPVASPKEAVQKLRFVSERIDMDAVERILPNILEVLETAVNQ